MDVRELVRAIVQYDALRARQWVADAATSGLDWSGVPFPEGLSPIELTVAAGVVELLASRNGSTPPAWTAAVEASPTPVYLVRAAATMPRLRKSCEEDGPEPLRRRRVFAPTEFLTFA